MFSSNELKKLKLKALKLRQDTLIMFQKKKEAHLGGSFSMIEIIVAIYSKILKKKDKFILSKSHASFPLCILLREKGLKPKITTHLEIDEKNGIFSTTGSLGHGLPIAAGMAFANKILKKRDKIYVLISDGECQEGTTWETLLFAAKHKLENLIILIDYNKIQALSRLDDALAIDSLAEKFRAFKWVCEEVEDGHDFASIIPALDQPATEGPRAVLLHTVKGKGIPQFEDDPVWHARKLKGDELEVGKKALGIP